MTASTQRKRINLLGLALAAILLLAATSYIYNGFSFERRTNSNNTIPAPQASNNFGTGSPALDTEVLLKGRANVWDIDFLPTSELLFTERAGAISLLKNGKVTRLGMVENITARGEGGLMGLAVDPQFRDNQFIYACFNSALGDVRVARWKVSQDLRSLQDRQDIVTGIMANTSGRHSGCQLAFGTDTFLWIGTGDAAMGTQPQDPLSLNGKILHVDRNGKPLPDNAGPNFDRRVYSYGHRNTQGIAFFPTAKRTTDGTLVTGVTAEHGSNVDDEINELRRGNFGWAPPNGYDESGVSMTDKQRFPNAIDAMWSSGKETQAPSGVAVINGSKWRGWDGALALAILKDEHLKILRLDGLKVIDAERALEGDYGRLRAVTMGPDGALYVSTDNNKDDMIIRISPK